jgi:protein-S-isoprenylcysteine O-methyltransferase Ste14
VLVSFGIAGLTDSTVRAVLALILFALLRGKAHLEEEALANLHSEYSKYKEEVPFGLLPFLEG